MGEIREDEMDLGLITMASIPLVKNIQHKYYNVTSQDAELMGSYFMSLRWLRYVWFYYSGVQELILDFGFFGRRQLSREKEKRGYYYGANFLCSFVSSLHVNTLHNKIKRP